MNFKTAFRVGLPVFTAVFLQSANQIAKKKRKEWKIAQEGPGINEHY